MAHEGHGGGSCFSQLLINHLLVENGPSEKAHSQSMTRLPWHVSWFVMHCFCALDVPHPDTLCTEEGENLNSMLPNSSPKETSQPKEALMFTVFGLISVPFDRIVGPRLRLWNRDRKTRAFSIQHSQHLAVEHGRKSELRTFFLLSNQASLGDHQPYSTPTNGVRSKRGIFEGLVCELSEPMRAAKCTPPPGFQLRCQHVFHRDGARIAWFNQFSLSLCN